MLANWPAWHCFDIVEGIHLISKACNLPKLPFWVTSKELRHTGGIWFQHRACFFSLIIKPQKFIQIQKLQHLEAFFFKKRLAQKKDENIYRTTAQTDDVALGSTTAVCTAAVCGSFLFSSNVQSDTLFLWDFFWVGGVKKTHRICNCWFLQCSGRTLLSSLWLWFKTLSGMRKSQIPHVCITTFVCHCHCHWHCKCSRLLSARFANVCELNVGLFRR